MGNSLYSLKDFGTHTLFQPPVGYGTKPGAAEARQKRIDANNAWVASHPAQPNMRITGSFIYAHAPNYLSAVTLEWSQDKWLQELTRLKSFGMDTVIFQASAWNELHECYYPSQIFQDFRNHDVVTPMLQAANQLGLTVFLGGCGSVTCWKDKLTAGVVDSELARQAGCFRELRNLYRGLFQGFYFTPESAFSGTRNTELEQFLASLYGQLFQGIREEAPELRILMSPATFYYNAEAFAQMVESWCAMFQTAHPDILAPQDSIGCGCITLDHQDEAFRAWSEICRRCNIRLWSNVEVFECQQADEKFRQRRATTPERVRCQMANAEPYVEKLITWEALYYGSTEFEAIGAEALTRDIFQK